MAEYIEKQKIKEQLQLESDCRMIITLQDIFGIIDWFPATDVVPVVRCKECQEMIEKGWCSLHGTPMNINDFCSYGEKRK